MLKTFVSTTNKQACSIVNPAMNDAPLEFSSFASEKERRGKGVSSSASIDDIPVWIEDVAVDRRFQERHYDRNRTSSSRSSRERNMTPRQERGGRKDEGRSFIREDHGIESSTASSHLFSPFSSGIADTTATLSGVLPTIDPSQWTMNPYALMSVGDPTLLGMLGMAGFGQFGFVRGPETPLMNTGVVANMMTTVREVIQLSSCVLYPPKPNAPMPTRREKPPGCRTVFVGGLPENTTEDIIREIFSRCGEINTIRTSKKNFCHIRYEMEDAVDGAVYLSGYRMRIDDKGDGPNTGRLHVDYAQARDDQYEWECLQRAAQREQRHRERMEQERLRLPSPPPIIHYSEHEASLLIEKLRGEESFQKAVQILITWLDRGESTKKNAGHFYSMIQSTNSHVRRLMNEKGEYEEELNKARQLLKQRMQGILIQFNQIEKVFLAASHQKVWDHFTKPQRKNIDMWRKQTEEIKNAQLEEVLNEREEDEMELSDEDMPDPASKKQKVVDYDGSFSVAQQSDSQPSPDLLQGSEVVGLQEENDSLRCQLEAYRNEVEVLKVEGQQDKDNRERQIKVLQQALQGMQQQLLGLSQQRLKEEEELNKLRSQVQNPSSSDQGEDSGEKTDENVEETLSSLTTVSEITSTSAYRVTVTEKDARLIGLISTFLHVHPLGAGVDYIWSYLQQLDCTLQPRDVEGLMLKFPSVFRQELSGVGATLERRWNFTGFVLTGANAT